MRRMFILLSLIFMLVGCSTQNEIKEIKVSDLCITHTSSDKEICYGDNKVDVEKITGLTTDLEPYLSIGYENGISIMYRDDKVVQVMLKTESSNVYEIDYAKIGESKTSIINRFGTSSAINNAPINLDYSYNTHTKKFMSQMYEDVDVESHEDMEKVYILSFIFDNDGNAETIMFTDMKMGIYMY